MRKFRVTVNGEEYEVEIEEVQVEAKTPVSRTDGVVDAPGSSPVSKTRPIRAGARKAPKPEVPEDQKPRQPQPAAPAGEGEVVEAPLPGTVLEVMVSEGQQVEAGDVLVILEAMKMENEIVAPVSGTVREVLAQKGSTVNPGDVLVVLG